jgi:hypothetical protein
MACTRAVVKASMQLLQHNAPDSPYVLAVAVFNLSRTVMHALGKLVVSEITIHPKHTVYGVAGTGCGCERTASSKPLIVDGKQVQTLYMKPTGVKDRRPRTV